MTDLRVSQRNVYHLMRGGRARWKIENETFNTLKIKATTSNILRAWHAESLGSVCGRDDVGVFGGPDPTAVLRSVPRRVNETGQQTSVMGAYARLVL